MDVDVSAAYGEGIILSQREYDKISQLLDNSKTDYWRYFCRIDCHSDESDYFFGKILEFAEAGYANEVGQLEIEDPCIFSIINRGIQEINKMLGTVKSKGKILLCFLD